MESRILVIVITAIIGGTLGFGMSYAVLNNQIASVETELSSLSTTVENLPTDWTHYDLTTLNTTTNALGEDLADAQSDLDAVNASLQDSLVIWVPEPAYDSGWVDIINRSSESFNITHSLNTTNILVDITGRAMIDGGTHQRNLGGAYYPGWTRSFEVHSIDEVAQTVVQTVDGGFVTAGYKESPSSVFRLVRYSALGNMIWEKQYDHLESYQEICYSMVQTSDGGYALTGFMWAGTNEFDAWLVKTDSNGNMVWNQTYGGTGRDMAMSLIQTADGGYALAGYTKVTWSSVGYFWLVKTDNLGNMEWSKTYGGSNDDEAFSIIQTSDGGYAVAGQTNTYGAGDYDLWFFNIMPCAKCTLNSAVTIR